MSFRDRAYIIYDSTPENMRDVADRYEAQPFGQNFVTEIKFFRDGANAIEKLEQAKALIAKRDALGDSDLLDLLLPVLK